MVDGVGGCGGWVGRVCGACGWDGVVEWWRGRVGRYRSLEEYVTKHFLVSQDKLSW